MKMSGPAVCLGSDIDTDLIIAGRYLRTKDHRIWVEHLLEDLDPTIAKRVSGAVLVTGKNFGCGSSREQAARALKESGVLGIIAPSFSRIFFRNGINIGLPLIECDLSCQDGEIVTFDMEIRKVTIGTREYPIKPLSSQMEQILRSGGLVNYLRSKNDIS